MTKIISWNVNSIRKGIYEKLEDICNSEDPDILCFQETKATKKDGENFLEGKKIIKKFPYRYWKDSVKGHAGVAIFSKNKPLKVIETKEEVFENRLILLEYEKFVLLNTYVPNTGRGAIAEEKRNLWHLKICELIKTTMSEKLFIWCGDLNVVSNNILDTSHGLARTKKSPAGMKVFEHEQFCEYLKLGLTDVYRHFFPNVKSFTWYSNLNETIGWRIDYFLTNKIDDIKEIFHYEKLTRDISDHVPLYIIF